MKKILAFLFLLYCMSSLGQNLLNNPSFENYIVCPTATNQIDSVVDWSALTQSPDYFNSCTSVSQVSVPSNFAGYQPANSGNAYCGMICYNASDYREYIGTQITSPLIIGQKYFISFYLNLSNNLSLTAINKFGCKLSTVPYEYNSLIPNNNAVFYSDSIITDTVNWTFIKGSFIADSAYNYIAFGNFFDNAHTDTLGGNGFDYQIYLYIDDVCLTTDSLVCPGNSEQVTEIIPEIGLKIMPNPCSKFFTIYTKDEIYSFKLFNLFGDEILYDENPILPSTTRNTNVANLSKGIYFIHLTTKKKTYTKKIIIQ